MQPNLTHTVRRLLRTAVFVFCFVLSALFSQGQSREKQEVPSVNQAAPHLPAMIKASGKDVFHGENSSYALNENEARIKAWVKNYPSEFTAYQVAIEKYIAGAKLENMRSAEKTRYHDLKAQWVMIQQMNLTLNTSEIKQNSN